MTTLDHLRVKKLRNIKCKNSFLTTNSQAKTISPRVLLLQNAYSQLRKLKADLSYKAREVLSDFQSKIEEFESTNKVKSI